MRILTEAEYERRLEAAKEEGYLKAERDSMERREFEEFRRSMWNELEGIKRSFSGRLSRLEDRIGPEGEYRKTPTNVNSTTIPMTTEF